MRHWFSFSWFRHPRTPRWRRQLDKQRREIVMRYLRGTRPAGISLACGYGRRSASTGTKRWIGTSVLTRLAEVVCSSSTPPGVPLVAGAIPQTLRRVSSCGALMFSGVVTAAVGESGQRPGRAG